MPSFTALAGVEGFFMPSISPHWSLGYQLRRLSAENKRKISMMKRQLLVLALASALLNAHSSEFADAVVSYDPGIGYVAGFTNAEASLGEPSRSNPFGDPTDPFDPPYGKQQIVSIGAGGSLTVFFQTPILNHPNNVYGL